MKIRSFLGVIGLALIFGAPLAVAQQVPHPVSGPSTSTIGDYACWGNALGQGLVDCGSISNPVSGPSTTTVGDIATWASTNGRSLADSVLGALTVLPGGTTVVQTLTSMFGLHPYLTWWGAKSDGSADIAAALNAAVSAVQGSPANPVVYVPAGEYLLNGSGGSVALSHVTLDCEGTPADALASPSGTGAAQMGHQGATFWLTSTSVVPFTLGDGVKVEGCNFYWPNQTGVGTAISVGTSPFTYTNSTSLAEEVNVGNGTVSAVSVGGVAQPFTNGTFNVPAGSAIVVTYSALPTMAYWQPIVYPSLFTEAAGGASNVDLIRDRVINAYDFFDEASASDPIGAIHLDGTSGYAIHDWLDWAYNPETSTIRGMVADINLFQLVGFGGHNDNFAGLWTANNGEFLHVFGNATSEANGGVGGVVMTGSTVFGYHAFVDVDSTGVLSESSFTGNVIDGTPFGLTVGAGGCAVLVAMHNEWYSYTLSPGYGAGGAPYSANDIDNNPLFGIYSQSGQTCITDQLDLAGDVNIGQGDILDVVGPDVKSVSLHDMVAYYGGTAASGNYYPVQSNSAASLLVLHVNNDHFEAPVARQGPTRQGIYLNDVYEAAINGNTFNGVYNGITLNFSSTGHVSGAANIAISSPAGAVGVGGIDYIDVHNLLLSGVWDLQPSPAVGTCGTSPSMTAGASDGRFAIQVGSGTVTSCAMTFAVPYSGNPVCTATSTVAPLSIATISTTGITWSSGATNMAGAQIYGSCKP